MHREVRISRWGGVDGESDGKGIEERRGEERREEKRREQRREESREERRREEPSLHALAFRLVALFYFSSVASIQNDSEGGKKRLDSDLSPGMCPRL